MLKKESKCEVEEVVNEKQKKTKKNKILYYCFNSSCVNAYVAKKVLKNIFFSTNL